MTIKTKKAAVEPLKSVIAITIEQIPTAYHSDKRPQGDNAPYDNCQPLSNTHRVEDLFGYKDTNNSINNLKKLINNWNITDEKSFVYIVANYIGAEPSIERQKRANKAEEISYYLNLPQYSLRIGLHNLNAENYTGVRNRPMNHGVTLKDLRKKDTFKAKKGVKVNEYVYIYWTEQRLKNIAKAILHLLETGVWDKTIAEPDYTNPKTDINKPISGIPHTTNFKTLLVKHELFGLGSIIPEPTKQTFYENLYNQLESIVKNDSFEKNGIRNFILSHIPEDYKNDDIEGIVEVFYQRLRALKCGGKGLGEVRQNFKDLIVSILSQNGYTNGKDYKIRYFKSSPYRANRGEKNVQECWLTVRNAPSNIPIREDDWDDIESLTDYVCGAVDTYYYDKKKAKQATTFHVGDLICYKGVEESVFKIVGFKGNNYIVIELGDRTRTKNEIPFADKDKLQRALSPLLITEAKLAKTETSKKIAKTSSNSLKMSDEDRQYFSNTKLSERDFKQMEDAVQYTTFERNGRKISAKTTIETLGRERFWWGMCRSAFHQSACVGDKEPYIYFNSSKYFSINGISGTSENLSGHFKIKPIGTSTPTKIIDKGDDFSYFDYPKDVIDKFYTFITLSKLDKAIPVYSNYFFDDDGHLCFATSRRQDIIDLVDIDRCLKGYEDLKHEWIAKAEDNINGFIWQFFINDTEFSPRGSYNYKILNRDLVELLLGYARKFEETSEIYPDKLGVENLQDYNKTKEILTKRLAELNKPKQPKKTPTIPTVQPEKLLTFDRNRLSMSCVHCENGYKVVTDAHSILKFKSDYPKQYEGKNVMPKHFFKKFEEFIFNPETVLFCNEDSYPNYEPAIKSILAKIKYSASIDIQSLYQYICALIDYYEKQTGEEIKVENRHIVPFFYNGQYAFSMDIARLKKWLSAAKLIQADTIKWVDYSYGVVFQNSKSDNGDILVIMPYAPRDTDKSITDGKCLIDVDWDIWYKPYDFANTRKANILITEAKLCTLRKTAEKRTPPPSMSEIVAMLDSHEFSGEPYTEADKEKLSQYQGIGGKGKEHGANVGILNQYYTPVWVCECMYKLAKKYGFKGGSILEPSAATGNMIKPFYDRGDYNHIDAFEIDKLTAKICKILYPDVEVMNQYFETAFLEYPRFTSKARKPWLKNYPYDLVIGNPPYGVHKNLYSGYFTGKDHFQQIEMFFIYKALQLLKTGGLLIYITSINFMSTGLKTYAAAKKQIGEIAEFVDAYRLPSVFDNTPICTDIIVLRKK